MHIPSYVELNQLQGAHFATLAGALRNILNTDIALITYAQVIDGLPTADVAWDQYANKRHPDNPVNNHKTLCDGVLEKAKEFRANFAMGDVKMDREKVDRYKKTDPSPRSFRLRLIEMTACALHQIAVRLSQMENLHDPSTTNGYDIEGTTKWERSPDQWVRTAPWPTMFIKTNFTAYEQYPHGIDDIIGYWAENRILGGVALFDHSQSWEADDEPNVYFICTRANVTFRQTVKIYRPSILYQFFQDLKTDNESIHLRLFQSIRSHLTMALPPGITEVRPEGYFVGSSSLTDEGHIRNPMCVEGSRCYICRFPIDREKDKIVTLTPDGRVSSPFTLYHEKYYAPLYIDKSLNMSFRHCLYPYCAHKSGLAVAFHAECTRMAARFGKALTEYRSLTEYTYQPASLDYERRRAVIRRLVENALRKEYGKLSPELWHMISNDDDLIRLYTIAEMSLLRGEIELSADPSTSVWITRVNFDGVEYVSSLSNFPRPESRQAWESISLSAGQFLYISNDYLGIRQVISDPSRAKSDAICPEHWKTVPIDGQMLLFTGDGLKLRELTTPSIYSRVEWPYPMTSFEIETMSFYFAGWGEGQTVARMRALAFNESGTTGYSVCWAGHEMVSLHAHRSIQYSDSQGSLWNEAPPSEYEDRSHLKWTYHPIDQDEYIQQIWIRGSDMYGTTKPLPTQSEGGLGFHFSTPWGLQTYKRPSDIALGFVTSKGRTIVAGSFPAHHGEHTPFSKHRGWLLVARTDTDDPIRIFFSPSTHGIPLIAAPAMPAGNGITPPLVQIPLSAMPRFNPLHTVHFSSASLENVVGVMVCRSKSEKDTAVIRDFDLENECMNETRYKKVAGLLLQYANGSQASVGCFRFDWSEPPLETVNSRGLFVGTRPGKIAQIPPHVAAVDVKPPETKDEWTWRELPWKGTLEWWFSPYSLDTSIAHVA
ncbi:hypothetical protein KAF25_004320 [Fusarium avenaceum]|uniref:Uncharacterized protein n=1 Tax=Fusarium avenaceum TaxID=40199 RepID=A0A9P7KQJ1_9HYPO|nr:hypothetical protein KAF25_004320 [Fusarium avenaceum]